MEYRIEPADGGRYLHVTVTGEVTAREAAAMNRKAHLAARKRGVSSFLVDMRQSRTCEGPAEAYRFTYQDMLRIPEIMPYAKTAVVTDPTERSHDFIETVARNSGLDTRIFRDMESAMRCLG